MQASVQKLLISALFASLLAACGTTPTTDSGAPVEDRNIGPGTTGAATSGTATGNVAGTASGSQGNRLRDPNSILSKRSVYFDFDSYAVKDDYKPLIDAHARYLQGERNGRMTIQGNTDERGSREYNLALGQKRAEAVRKQLALVGVPEAQIEAVSLGKEKPRATGHDEAAWAENRRADFVYQ